jgi:hypothetical protein
LFQLCCGGGGFSFGLKILLFIKLFFLLLRMHGVLIDEIVVVAAVVDDFLFDGAVIAIWVSGWRLSGIGCDSLLGGLLGGIVRVIRSNSRAW